MSNSSADITSTEASIFAWKIPQSSAHWPWKTPVRFAWNHVLLTLPGIASIFPASAWIHHEWMTSQSGAVTSSSTVRPTGARMVSKATTPFG